MQDATTAVAEQTFKNIQGNVYFGYLIVNSVVLRGQEAQKRLKTRCLYSCTALVGEIQERLAKCMDSKWCWYV